MLDRILDDTYRLIEEIGKGGFGAVYKGVRKDYEGLGPVAIKVLNRHHSMKSKDYARFQREASLMSQLVHPGIVTVYELVQTDSCYYIVMELVNGANLKDYVSSRGGSLSLLEILDVLIQVSDALEYVHGHRIEHRDIKPHNILICERGTRSDGRFQVKLVDFGVARLSPQALGGHKISKAEVVGTYAYMSPEATGLVELEIDHRSDIYSLGIVAYELLTGRLPFVRSGAAELAKAHAYDKPPSLSEALGRDVSPQLEAIIQRCIAKSPVDRYQSIFGLSCDLKLLRSDLVERGRISSFPIAGKDLDLMRRFHSVFIGRDEVVGNVIEILGIEKQNSRLTWTLLRGAVGVGKSRSLDEIRSRLEELDVRYLYLKFSESEKRLPYQALALAVNDYLVQFERSKISEFRELLEELIRKSGVGGARQLASIIPALRPFLEENFWKDDEKRSELVGSPSMVLNQAFKELFDSMVGKSGNRLVFLLDDIHLGDSSTIALLTYLIEGMNTGVNYSVVLTIRDGMHTLPQMVDGLLKRAAGLKRRFHELLIGSFDESLVTSFFERIGIQGVNHEFVQYAMRKTDSSPLQLQVFVKQLVTNDALIPLGNRAEDASFQIDWQVLRETRIELFNVETLISKLGRLEERDRKLLTIAAVSQSATRFELFKVDSDFSTPELETRLMALVKRGLLEDSGEENLPVMRRSFHLTHEKLRAALMADVEPEQVRRLHLLLAKRIKSLHRNLNRVEVLQVAKHIDGASELYDPKEATSGFLKAARVSIAEMEHNLARYYIEKAQLRLGGIESHRVRNQLLREVYEAKYMIFAAQGNLVAASEVCRSLVDMTPDPVKKQKLQLYWAQLQLSLGRHTTAYQQSRQLVESRLTLPLGQEKGHPLLPRLKRRFERFVGNMLFRAIGRRAFLPLYWAVSRLGRGRQSHDPFCNHALALMALSQLHGHEGSLHRVLFLMARLDVLGTRSERWAYILHALLASFQIRKGKTREAYRSIEAIEKLFRRGGQLEALRWLVSIKAVWFDYPTGRMDRLFQVFADTGASEYPSSGLLHFETYGLRAWLRLIAPSQFSLYEIDPSRDRRKSRGSSDSQAPTGKFKPGAPLVFQIENLIENNNARRVLDSGENGQFTALALFSDALRFALGDRIDSLKKSCEQMQRQRTSSALGDAFQVFGMCLLAHVSGRHAEALRSYKRACRRILRSHAEVASVPVSDALRYAILFFPVVSFVAGRRSWLWGPSLLPWLEQIDAHLTKMEGKARAPRSAMAFLFSAMKSYARGETRNALTDLDSALRESRVQKMALLECLSMCMLGVFSAERKIRRAGEHLNGVYGLAKQYRWKLFERFVQTSARNYGFEIQGLEQAEDSRASLTSRGRTSHGAFNHLMRNMSLLLESKDLKTLLSETTKMAADTLGANAAYFFLKSKESNQFECLVEHGEIRSTGQVIKPGNISKWLPTSLDEYVKIVPLDDFIEHSIRRAGNDSTTAHTTLVSPPETRVRAEVERIAEDEIRDVSSEATVAIEGPDTATVADAVSLGETVLQELDDTGIDGRIPTGHETSNLTKTGNSESIELLVNEVVGRSSARNSADRQGAQLLIMVSVSNYGELLGWMAIPDATSRFADPRDTEQELIILGMHVGYLVGKFLSRMRWTQALPKRLERPERKAEERQLPDSVRIEEYSSGLDSHRRGWKVLGVRSRLLIVSSWRFDASKTKATKRLGDLFARHLELFSHSLRLQLEIPKLESVADKLVNDFTAIFATVGHQVSSTDGVDLNFLVFDLVSRRSYEGIFGVEMFSFTGESRVEKEHLHEMQSVHRSGRSLIFRERIRKVSGHCGWAFGLDSQTRTALFRFAELDFLEKYLPCILDRANLLPETLGVQARGRGTELLALFALDETQISLQDQDSNSSSFRDDSPSAVTN